MSKIEINALNSNNYIPYENETTITKEIKETKETSCESRKIWTDAEYKDAMIKLYTNNGERANEVDLDSYIEELRRRTTMADRTNQFDYVLRDFKEGINNDGFGPRISTGYDSGVFSKLATTFFEERNSILKNWGGYFTDEEVDLRLKNLHEQFDKSFQGLAEIFKGYANDLYKLGKKDMNIQNIDSDIKSIGEIIKFYVCSNSSQLNTNITPPDFSKMLSKTDFHLDELNIIGTSWFSRFTKGSVNFTV